MTAEEVAEFVQQIEANIEKQIRNGENSFEI